MTLRRNQPPSAESPVVIETIDAACRIHHLPTYSALRAQNEALQQDARRYRLIRDSGEFVVYAVDDGDDGTGVQEIEIPGGALDATVDATPAALQDEQAADV